MEKLLAFQNKLKNKMREKIQSDLETEISEKEKEISDIKEKYENQTHKEGFFLKIHYNDCKNNYTSKRSFFIIVFVFLFLLFFNIFFYTSLNGKEAAVFGVYCFSFMVLSFIPFMIFYMSVFESYYFEKYKSKNIFHFKTHLTMIYETLENDIILLKEKLSNLDQDLDDYINNLSYSAENLNQDDIYDVTMIVLSKEDLDEISKILTKDEIVYLSIESFKNAKNTINIRYCDILSFINFKKENKIEDVVSLIFKTF